MISKGATNNNIAFYMVLSLVLVLLLFLYFPPERAAANSHDYLDHWFMFYTIWGGSENLYFNLDYQVQRVLGGIPVNVFGFSEFSFAESMYKLFSPFTAHSIIASLITIIAFVGSYVLLKDEEVWKIFRISNPSVLLILYLSLLFALLPHKTIRVLVASGIPILLWSYLHIWKGSDTKIHWTIAFLFPFFASFPYGGYTVCGILLLFTIYSFVVNRGNKYKVLALFCTTIGLYILILYRSFYHWFFASYHHISDRQYKIYDSISNIEFKSIFMDGLDNFIFYPGQHHTTGVNKYLMLIVWSIVIFSIIYLIITLLKDNNRKNITKHHSAALLNIMALLGILFLISIIRQFDKKYFLLQQLFDIPLQLIRIDSISLTLVILVLFLSINSLLNSNNKRIKVATYFLMMVLLLSTLFHTYGLRMQVQRLLGFKTDASGFEIVDMVTNKNYQIQQSIKPPSVNGRHRQNEFSQLREYFEIEAFKDINEDVKNSIGSDFSLFKVISFGLSPSVSWYHGYTSVDARLYDRPIAKIEVMNRLFIKEILKDYHDIDKFQKRNTMTYVAKDSVSALGISPEIDMDYFHKIGGRIIFSLYKITNNKSLGIELLGEYNGTTDSIYVYILP
jgi:hypothetical protein